MRVKPIFAFALALLLTLPCRSEEDEEEEGEGDEGDDPEADEGQSLRDGEPMNAEQLKILHGKIDSNGDGKVSLAELLAHPEGINTAAALKGIKEVFEETDANKDGRVTLEEYLNDLPSSHLADEPEQHKQELAEYHKLETAKFKAGDVDGDGLLNTTELMGIIYPHTHTGVLHVTASETLRQKDANGDGALTKHEFWEPPPLEDGKPGEVEDDQHQDFAELDRNGDGQLDLEELKFFESGQFQDEQSIRKFFGVADADKDGHISSEEMAVSLDNSEDPDAHNFLGDWMDHYEL